MALVLAHEQGHLTRHDHWWKPLGFALLALTWFNPLAWIAYVYFCKDIELACDERVTKDLSDSERADYSQALLDCGEKARALETLRYYWGGMVDAGADTFWELYNPDNPEESPYGGTIVNSYCHAWSCAPAYFLRKYFQR